MYLRLVLAALCPVAITLIFYFFEKKTKYGKINDKLRQVIVGIVFGIIACLATQFGIPGKEGYVMNVRGAAPLTAGLLFGGYAGVIAGAIGAIYRWISIYFFGVGEYTVVACSVATLLAGCIGAICRNYMFDNKKPSWFYGFFISITTEVFHMLLVFITHMDDIHKAFSVVQATAIPMIISNGISVMLSTLCVSLLSSTKRIVPKYKRPISQTFSVYLFICVFVAYFVTSVFTYNLQESVSEFEVKSLLTMNVGDVEADVRTASDRQLLDITRKIANNIEDDGFDSISAISSSNDRDAKRPELAEYISKYNVSLINLVDSNGVITLSTNKKYDNYRLGEKKNGQAEEFLRLTDGEKEYVQSYQPMDSDETVYMKYAGVAISGGRFVQVGYDDKHFAESVSDDIYNVATNRHIGKAGFIFIINPSNSEIVSAPKNTATQENIIKFTKELNSDDANKILQFTDLSGEKYFYMFRYVEGYLVIGCLPYKEAVFSRDTSVYIGLFMQVVVFAILFILIYFLIKKIIVNNIRKINSSLAKITSGDLSTVVEVRESEEFSSLSDDINTTVSRLKDYISEAEARIDKELEFAKTIQFSALPSVFPPYPTRKEFEIYASMITAKEVGGDFYDFYFVGENKLAFLIADVSGKGIPAAMFMMTSKTMIKSYAESGADVADVFTMANQKLCETNDAGMFVTAWMGIIDLTTGIVKYANAGHNPPLVKRKDGSFEYLKSPAGFVLAGMEGVKYKEKEIILEPGDEIYLYTDGVTEATSADTELYGDERLLNVLNAKDYNTSKDVCDAVKCDVDKFVADAPQFDDITMLSFKYKSKEEGAC